MQYGNTGKEIISIQKKKKEFEITWDNNEVWMVPENVSLAFLLYVGKVMSEDEKKELKRRIQYDPVKKDALRSLARKDYSTLELKNKLLEKYPYPFVDQAIKECQEIGLLSDERLKEQYISFYLEKKYGPNFVREKLKEKGISFFDEDEEKWNGLIEEFLSFWVEKLFEKEKGSQLEKIKKIEGKLIRLGFSRQEIKEKLSLLKKDEDEEKKSFDKLYQKYKRKKVKGDHYQQRQKMIQYFISHGYQINDILKWIGEDEV